MKHLMIAMRQVLSLLDTVIGPPNVPILQREITPGKKTLPSTLITDPKFVYQSAACTDISKTFEKAKNERLQRLLNDVDGNRKQNEGTEQQVPIKKLRRVHG
jgi:hypothetical protein